jgi:predicted methyltransferase
MQAVHELRHKRHVEGLYEKVLRVLRPGGSFLVCDHVVRDPLAANADLFMTRGEQHQALVMAEFCGVETLMDFEGMTLLVGRKPG